MLAPPAWAAQLHSVGVTGTNGKTSTTTWLAYALAERPGDCVRVTTLGVFVDAEQVACAPSYDGVLGALHGAQQRGARAVAMEMTSEALAKGYAKAWPCKVAVFTNLSHDHISQHGSFEHYLASKAQLFVALPADGVAVLNAACESYPLLTMVTPPSVRVLSYASTDRGPLQLDDAQVFLRIDRLELSWAGTRVHYTCADPRFPGLLDVPAHGSIYAENAVAALLGAFASGVDPKLASARIATAPVPAGRFERVADAPAVVVDFAHTPDALERTLRTARALTGGRVILVFGAGGNRDAEKRPLLGQAARAADRVLLTSDNPRGEPSAAIADEVRAGLAEHPDVQVILDRAQAIAAALEGAADEDLVLIAGKGHETTQQVGAERRYFSDHQVARDQLSRRTSGSKKK